MAGSQEMRPGHPAPLCILYRQDNSGRQRVGGSRLTYLAGPGTAGSPIHNGRWCHTDGPGGVLEVGDFILERTLS